MKDAPVEVKTADNALEVVEKSDSIVTETPTEDKTQIIRKKREYKTFIKLIQSGKFTTAYLTAKILRVDYHTIQEWLHTTKAIEAMRESVDRYVEDIQQSKDWKAKAYLLDKLTPDTKEDKQSIDLRQLIVINTK